MCGPDVQYLCACSLNTADVSRNKTQLSHQQSKAIHLNKIPTPTHRAYFCLFLNLLLYVVVLWGSVGRSRSFRALRGCLPGYISQPHSSHGRLKACFLSHALKTCILFSSLSMRFIKCWFGSCSSDTCVCAHTQTRTHAHTPFGKPYTIMAQIEFILSFQQQVRCMLQSVCLSRVHRWGWTVLW